MSLIKVVLDPTDFHFLNYFNEGGICRKEHFYDNNESFFFFVQSTEEPRLDRSPIKDITVQIIDLMSKHNGNSTIIKAITGVRVHQTPSPKTGKHLSIILDIGSIFAESSRKSKYLGFHSRGQSCWTVCPWSVLLEQC